MKRKTPNSNALRAFQEYKMEVANELSISDKTNFGNSKEHSLSDKRDTNSLENRIEEEESRKINKY